MLCLWVRLSSYAYYKFRKLCEDVLMIELQWFQFEFHHRAFATLDRKEGRNPSKENNQYPDGLSVLFVWVTRLLIIHSWKSYLFDHCWIYHQLNEYQFFHLWLASDDCAYDRMTGINSRQEFRLTNSKSAGGEEINKKVWRVMINPTVTKHTAYSRLVSQKCTLSPLLLFLCISKEAVWKAKSQGQ